MAEFNTRIKLKRDTSANWMAIDPVLLNGEIIIVDTAAGDVRRKIGDGIKKYSQLPFDDEELSAALSGKSDKSYAVYSSLSASGWTDGRQEISVSGLGENQNGMIGLSHSVTDEQLSAASDAEMYICGQSDGSITIASAGKAPVCDIPVVIILLG